MSEAGQPPLPRTFTIETSLACNLRCPECAIGGGMIERRKGLLSLERFEQLAEKIRPHCKYLYLHLWGEPLLNRDIVPIIRTASRFTATNISTNAIPLTEPLARDLVTSGVTEIIVSIDGASQEVYQRYRVGGDLEKAFEGLRMLQEQNLRHGRPVTLSPQFIVFRHNEHEMSAFEQRCRELGLTAQFKAPYLRSGDGRLAPPQLPQYRRPQYPDVESARTAMRGCPNVRDVFTVLLDGTVVACCHDYAGQTRFGNLYESDVAEIWNAPAYQAFRAEVLGGRAPPFCLENCMTYLLASPTAPAQPPPEVKAPTPERTVRKVNLCSGARKLSGYVNVDLAPGSDLVLDLEHSLLPFPDESVDVLVCMSAINYFTRARAQEILLDVHRVLRPGGIVRFGTQDLRVLTRRYLDRDEAFWCQKLPDGRDRFPGPTLADKLNEFFYGFHSHGKPCRFVHDFESLRELFRAAGFEDIFERRFRESALPDVDQIDNRPEQMFFMEASKASERAQEPAGRSAHRAGQVPPRPHPAAAHPPSDAGGELEPERAWQRLLSRLTKDPGDAEAARECAATLERQERFDDLALLWTRYLSAHPGDPDASRLNGEAKRRAAEHRAALEKRARGNASQVSRLRDHQNRVLPDREHLDAAMSWLCRAQDHNGRGGVSAMYTVATRSWAVDYPETTGYLIPTFLAYAELTGSAEHLARARRMAEWELAIQAPDGGAGEPVGVFGQSPRVFNTGQVLLGWLALHRHAPDPRYLDASRRAGDWISASIEPDGSWCRNTYRGPRAYKSRVAWALLELHSATGEERYREAAERAIGWTLSRALPNGWFADCSLSDPEKPWTHLIGYVLVGLQEALQHASTHIDRGAAEALLDRAAQGISIAYLEAKQAAPHRFVPLPGTFDRRWLPGDRWSCVTGTAQLEFFLRRLGQRRAEQAYLQTADALLDEVKRLHLLDGITDPDLHGGLPGSHPIEEGYCSGALPNWGVKFFADGLIQRLRPGTHLIG